MEFVKRKVLKPHPPCGTELGFGRYFTDYAFLMRYTREKGWHGAAIVPNEPQPFDLASSIFHYAQGVFEGMKAFSRPDGGIAVFRPEENWARMERSCARLCIPAFPKEEVQRGLDALLRLEQNWIPKEKGTALYIRPVAIATRPALGVHASDEYLFYIILSPVGNYYPHGLSPVRLLVEDVYARAPLGGTGEAKCLGNYAASLLAGAEAEKKGYEQVLWLDAHDKKYVEEAGSMNVFFVLNGEVVTPALTGSILPGITRKSCLQLLREEGIPVSERRISIDEIMEAGKKGTLEEVFGTGTAAVISPVGTLHYKGEDCIAGKGNMGELTHRLYQELTGVQDGSLPDRFGWMYHVPTL